MISDITVLQPCQQNPSGKPGKSPRIISAEVRENKEALLAMLEEALPQLVLIAKLKCLGTKEVSKKNVKQKRKK